MREEHDPCACTHTIAFSHTLDLNKHCLKLLTAGFRVYSSMRIMGRFIIEARIPKVGEGSALLPRRPTLATC